MTGKKNKVGDMKSIRQTQKKYCSRALIAAIVIGSIFIITDLKPVGKGLILGAIFSSVNFVLIGETLPLKLGKSKNKIFLLSLGSIVLRFGLLAVPLIIAFRFEQFNFIAAACGIFMVQIVILLEHLFQTISSFRKSKI